MRIFLVAGERRSKLAREAERAGALMASFGDRGRRYCGENTGVLMCIFGVGEVGDVVVTEVGYE